MTTPAWLVSPEKKYGASIARTNAPADPSATHLAAVAGPSVRDAAHPVLSPHSPLLWLGVLAAATIGLASFSTTVKVGPAGASVKVG